MYIYTSEMFHIHIKRDTETNKDENVHKRGTFGEREREREKKKKEKKGNK